MKHISEYLLGFDVSRVKQELDSVLAWIENDGSGTPPPSVKQSIIRGIAKRNNMKVFIETGTYMGDMVEAQKNQFEKIYSIELDRELYLNAEKKFKPFSHIKIYQGDSKIILPQLIRQLKSRALFWLDAHFSGGITAKGEEMTPILYELEAIMKNPIKGHVILIDDASDFNGKEGYPTLRNVQTFIKRRKPGWNMYVQDNIIRIHG